MDFKTFVSWLDVDEDYRCGSNRYSPDFNENISYHRPIVCTKKGVVGAVVVRKLREYASPYCMLSYGYMIPEDCSAIIRRIGLYRDDLAWSSSGRKYRDWLYNESILAFFKTCKDARTACVYAAEEISKEVEEAMVKNIPSMYFSTHFLTTDYGKLWPFASFRPDGDKGGTYKFEPCGCTSLFDRYYSYVQRTLGIPDCQQNKMVVYRCFSTTYSDSLPQDPDTSYWNMILSELQRYGIPEEIKVNVVLPGAEYNVADDVVADVEKYITLNNCGCDRLIVDKTKDTNDLNITV